MESANDSLSGKMLMLFARLIVLSAPMPQQEWCLKTGSFDELESQEPEDSFFSQQLCCFF